jgi:hypothetical protein
MAEQENFVSAGHGWLITGNHQKRWPEAGRQRPGIALFAPEIANNSAHDHFIKSRPVRKKSQKFEVLSPP